MATTSQTLGAFNQLPSWAKGIITVTGTGILLFGLYEGYKYLKKQEGARDANAVRNSAHDSYKDFVKKGQKLSLPESSYLSTANTIQKKLDGCERVTTEIEVIEDIIKVVKKPIDWYYLVYVFGNRDIDDCGVGTGSTNYDLITLLKDQLDSTLVGDMVNGIRYWNDTSLIPLSVYLAKIGISI